MSRLDMGQRNRSNKSRGRLALSNMISFPAHISLSLSLKQLMFHCWHKETWNQGRSQFNPAQSPPDDECLDFVNSVFEASVSVRVLFSPCSCSQPGLFWTLMDSTDRILPGLSWKMCFMFSSVNGL